jgi:hypothetical protein
MKTARYPRCGFTLIQTQKFWEADLEMPKCDHSWIEEVEAAK